MLDCWNSQPENRPTFKEIAAEVDQIMENTAGYLALSSVAVEKEGEAMFGDRSDTESPESISQLIRGIRTDAGIIIQLQTCGDSVHEDSQSADTNETSV